MDVCVDSSCIQSNLIWLPKRFSYNNENEDKGCREEGHRQWNEDGRHKMCWIVIPLSILFLPDLRYPLRRIVRNNQGKRERIVIEDSKQHLQPQRELIFPLLLIQMKDSFGNCEKDAMRILRDNSSDTGSNVESSKVTQMLLSCYWKDQWIFRIHSLNPIEMQNFLIWRALFFE